MANKSHDVVNTNDHIDQDIGGSVSDTLSKDIQRLYTGSAQYAVCIEDWK